MTLQRIELELEMHMGRAARGLDGPGGSGLKVKVLSGLAAKYFI